MKATKTSTSIPKPKVVQKSVPNRFERPDEPRTPPARNAGGGGIAVPAKTCNCGGAGLV
ncbi:hypothetical protein G3O06_07705 [Burkholderia sp. Ac-20345]|uniref:hypothetical protein n=1 Tax=Burkholderia sp. Ac-20345 TaxID=2703891 RepID=UPI00197C2A13|nr:hypothetical protein [Burkholderia sp. Ac-20345]MBN3777435.1 hypothetical protein [Burkholderia sp. Ac-20345]